MSRAALYVGMGQPYAIRFDVDKSDDFDPSLPTGATFHITKPDNTETTFAASLADQSADAVSAVHLLTASDLDMKGTWRAWVQWTVPGETPGPRTEVLSFQVLAKDQVKGA